jgi:transcriptional regulator with XRE-family HTH domain
MPQFSTNLGDSLHHYRKMMGYSQREAARLLGVSPSRLAQWEKGTLRPSIANLANMAVLYRVYMDELCYGIRLHSAKVIGKRMRALEDEKNSKLYKKHPP